MTIFCTVCKVEVPEKRAIRGSHFCSNSCHGEYRRARRSWRASKACRLCGRPLKQRRKEAPVPTAHTPSQDLLEGLL